MNAGLIASLLSHGIATPPIAQASASGRRT